MSSGGEGGSGRTGGPSPGASRIPTAHDGAALALLAAEDWRGAAAELIRVHGERAHDYLRALLRDQDAADDAYSLFCEWTLDAIRRYRGDSSLGTWALGVAFNAARRVRDDGYRRRRRTLRGRDASALPDRILTTSAARRERTARRLDELRSHLSEADQNLLVLRVDQGLEWEAIAGVLAAGGQAVSSQALRKRFERMKGRIERLARELGVFD